MAGCSGFGIGWVDIPKVCVYLPWVGYGRVIVGSYARYGMIDMLVMSE